MTPAKAASLMFMLGLGAACWASLANRATAADGMEWQFFQTPEPDYKSTRLVYGVPETDNVQVSGACVHSSSIGTNFSIVTFGADIGNLENGKDTDLRVSGGGFDHVLKGKIVRATGEEGLNGVEIDIGNDDPLWRAFAEKDSLDYLVPGYKAATLDFARGRTRSSNTSRPARRSARESHRLKAPRPPVAMPKRRRSRTPRTSAL